MKSLKEKVEKCKKVFFGKKGRKRDLSKTGLWAAVLAVAVFTALAGGRYGWEFSFPVKVVKLEKHAIAQAKASFSYPQIFSLDEDKQGRYGADYLAGFHLANDKRIGCDVRRSAAGVNLAKSDEEISAAIKNDLEKNVKGFAAYEFERDEIGGQEAARVSFELVDPLGSTLKVTQGMVSQEGRNYLVVCGAGKGVYGFFEKDFERFFRSFEWKK